MARQGRNPENPECSSSVQMLLDILTAMEKQGVDHGMIKQADNILDYLKNNPEVRQEADSLWHGHQYPATSITFYKHTVGLELERYVGATAYKILGFMLAKMRNGNRIQVSIADIMACIDISKRQSVNSAITELLDKGLIAVQFPAAHNRGATYMVNPSIGTNGTEYPNLQKEFWQLTGSIWGTAPDGKKQKYTTVSKPHKKYNELTASTTYSLGYGKQETVGGTVYYNVINPPKSVAKKKPADSVGDTNPQETDNC